MNKTMFLALCLSLVAAPAFAKKSTKNHHCVMADGSDAAAKTKKACKKAGGKWKKGMAKSASGTSGTTGGAVPPGDASGTAGSMGTGTTTPPAEPAK